MVLVGNERENVVEFLKSMDRKYYLVGDYRKSSQWLGKSVILMNSLIFLVLFMLSNYFKCLWQDGCQYCYLEEVLGCK